MQRAFVDYYRERGISPVRQDVADRAQHFSRRGALYRFLGIPPRYVDDADVLEFGPGSGANALYTASLAPRRYVLVDANRRGLEETRVALAGELPADRWEVVESLVEDYVSAERFDLVLAEGIVPFQHEPAAMARRIAHFAAPAGIVVVTCVDAVSCIGEVGRRLIANRLVPPSVPYAERHALLRPHFAPHLATLDGMSRTVDDWIDDNIVHPLTGRLFSIADAIAALAPDGFEVYGGSPHFVADWRWYKQVYGDQRAFNERAVSAYQENMINFLDYRVTLPPHDVATGTAIATAASRLYAAMQDDDRGEPDALAAALAQVRTLVELVAPLAPLTATSLAALAAQLAAPETIGRAPTAFDAHFGRGQQYLSFVRAG